LSEVTPLALTWDHGTTNASGGCARGAYGAASTVTACLDVLSYLTAQSTITSSFTSSFWQGGVDGPYKLSALSPTGNATFVANPTYAGPQRPLVATLTMVAFSSLAREEAALATNALDVGYVSASDVAPTSKVGQAGSNAQAYATHYNLSVASPWGFNEITLNADVTGASQTLLAQPYIRQALASSIDQSSMITSALRGYGLVTSSPLPASASALGAPKKNPWPFSLVNARSTLASHGWTLTGATLTCTSPGTSATQCGAGVTSGQPLSLPLVAASGDVVLSNELKTWSSDLAAMGVALSVTYDTISHVWGDCGIASAFALCASGQGWSYLGAHYPSGEALFGVGAASNLGGISDASLATLVASGALAPNPLGSFTPEYFVLR
jgi:peptide/nickel transport system substrate-binding protein